MTISALVDMKNELAMKTHSIGDYGFAIAVSSSIAWSTVLWSCGSINHADMFLVVQTIWHLFTMMTELLCLFRVEAKLDTFRFVNNPNDVSHMNMRTAALLRGIAVLFQLAFFEKSSFLVDLMPILEFGTIATAMLEMWICARKSAYSSTCCTYLLVLKWVLLRFVLSYCAMDVWVKAPLGKNANIFTFFGSITFFTAVIVIQSLWALVLVWNFVKRMSGVKIFGIESFEIFECELPEEVVLRKADAAKNWEQVNGGLFKKLYTKIFNQVKEEVKSKRAQQMRKWEIVIEKMVVKHGLICKFGMIARKKVSKHVKACHIWEKLSEKLQVVNDGLIYVRELVQKSLKNIMEAEQAATVVVGNVFEVVLVKAAEYDEGEYVMLENEDSTEYCSSTEDEEAPEVVEKKTLYARFVGRARCAVGAKYE